MVGLDGSGKTTIIHALTDQPADEVVPTVGYSMEQFKFGNAKVSQQGPWVPQHRRFDVEGWCCSESS
jgi:GTPase SAR1 family protein